MKKDITEIDDIILSFLEEKLTQVEKETLQEWIAYSDENKNYFKQVYLVWSAGSLRKDNSTNTDEVLRKLKSENNIFENKSVKSDFRKIIFQTMRWAAVILISVMLGATLYSIIYTPNQTQSELSMNEIVAPMGSKSQILLPDGTEVLLNAGSKISYSMEYGQKLRSVKLSGEAFFKVQKQKEKPFVVNTENVSITALGTEFNVMAYPNEQLMETILSEGSIEVKLVSTTNSETEKVILTPGEKASVKLQSKNGKMIPQSMQISKCDPTVETSWKDKRWIIKGMQLDRLATVFSRKYNIDIEIDNKTMNEYKFSGIIENETPEQVFHIMELALPVTCKMEKNKVIWELNLNE